MPDDFIIELEDGVPVDIRTISMEDIRHLIKDDPDLFPEMQSCDFRVLSWCQKIYDCDVDRGGTVLRMDSMIGREAGFILLMIVCEEEHGIKKYPVYNFVPFTPNWHLVTYLNFDN